MGYYRDYQINNSKYLNLNEAILEVFDAGFNTDDNATTKVRLYEYKSNEEFERDTLADAPYNYKSLGKVIDNAYLFGYGGNEFTILRVHDAIRNYQLGSYDFVHTMETDLLKNHSFKRVKDSYLGEEAFFAIRLRRIYSKFTAHGMLYISKRDFAIHKMEYGVYSKNNNYKSASKLSNTRKQELVFQVVTEYQRRQDKMFLNYISFNNSFLLNIPPVFLVENLEIYPEKEVFNFNKELERESAKSVKNFEIRYRKRRIKLAHVHLGKRQITLAPVARNDKTKAMFTVLSQTIGDKRSRDKLFSFDVKNIKDIEGNLINEWTSKNYNQFREFFVQQILVGKRAPKDTLYMANNRPIFKNQPFVKPDNYEDYWMNTPLQSID